MQLASVIKNASLLLVHWCLLLSTSFFVNDVVVWQAHSPNPVTTAYLFDLSYYRTIRCSSSNMFLVCQPLQ